MGDDAEATSPEAAEFDLATALGSQADYAAHCFSIYVPNKDKVGVEIGNQRQWVLEAIRLLSEVNGGATAMPPVEGAWLNDAGEPIWEHPVVAYSFIRPDRFFANLHRVRDFLHRMGRDTNQGEIAVEFDGRFFLIRDYDSPGGNP